MSFHVDKVSLTLITVVSWTLFVDSGTLKVVLVFQQLYDLLLEHCWHIKVNSARRNVDVWGFFLYLTTFFKWLLTKYFFLG